MPASAAMSPIVVFAYPKRVKTAVAASIALFSFDSFFMIPGS
jgi:hypothetical protein